MTLAPFTTNLRPDAKTPPVDMRKSHCDEEPAVRLWDRAWRAADLRDRLRQRAHLASEAYRKHKTRKTSRAADVAWALHARAERQWKRLDGIAASHTVWYNSGSLKERECVACYGEQRTEVSA